MKKFSTIIVLLILSFVANAEIAKFKSVPEMIVYFGDYNAGNGTFKMFTSEGIPDFQLSNNVVDGELKSVILEGIKRDLIYGVYRTFIHTDHDTVKITGIPLLLDLKNLSKRDYLQQYKATIQVKRDEVLQVAKKLFQVSSLSDLVSSSNLWTNVFNQGYYNDQGSPTLDVHYAALLEVSEKTVEKLYSLDINAIPSDSTIKIMNIIPKYKAGIKLKAGKYDVSVAKNGYGKWREWVEIVDSNRSIDVVLKSKYSCDKKYCKNISSCKEAYYKLNTCGHKRLDRDHDSVPCENVCPGG